MSIVQVIHPVNIHPVIHPVNTGWYSPSEYQQKHLTETGFHSTVNSIYIINKYILLFNIILCFNKPRKSWLLLLFIIYFIYLLLKIKQLHKR